MSCVWRPRSMCSVNRNVCVYKCKCQHDSSVHLGVDNRWLAYCQHICLESQLFFLNRNNCFLQIQNNGMHGTNASSHMPLRNIGCCYPFGKVTVAIDVSLPKPCLFIILLDKFHFSSCWQYGYGKSLLTLTLNLRLESANNSISIHPWKLKWNLKITQLNRKIWSKPNLHFGGSKCEFFIWKFSFQAACPSNSCMVTPTEVPDGASDNGG